MVGAFWQFLPGDNAEALEAFSRAGKLKPDNALAWRGKKAWRFSGWGGSEDTLVSFDRAINRELEKSWAMAQYPERKEASVTPIMRQPLPVR